MSDQDNFYLSVLITCSLGKVWELYGDVVCQSLQGGKGSTETKWCNNDQA